MEGTSEAERRHSASRLVRATPRAVYDAFMRPDDLAAWLPPGDATGEIEAFEPWPGGRFRMALTFSAAIGKSSSHRDVVEGRFLELTPGARIVQAIEFASDRPEFAGTMRMSWELSPTPEGTLVAIVAEDVPPGVGRADHELGMAQTLANLARFVERR
jgi:uncharacterized protein YndB with AHSA1/START domain